MRVPGSRMACWGEEVVTRALHGCYSARFRIGVGVVGLGLGLGICYRVRVIGLGICYRVSVIGLALQDWRCRVKVFGPGFLDLVIGVWCWSWVYVRVLVLGPGPSSPH